MRVLITGNMGYVGPMVVRHLRTELPASYLAGLDSAFFAQCLTSKTELPERFLNVQHFGDVREISSEQLRGFDAVVHLAAVSNDPMGNRFEAVTDEINHQASVNLARLSAAAGVKNFVFASSCSVYGFAADGRARREGDSLNPLTAYARSKIATEQSLRQLDLQGMTVTSLRFATACGMSHRLRLDLVLNDFVACAMSSGEITVLSDGTPWRPLIDVRDMARAIEWAVARRPDRGGQFLAVNVGAEEWNYQVQDLARAVADSIPSVKVAINKSAPPDKRSYRVDFGLFREVAPAHQPREDLKSTIASLQRGLHDMGFSDAGFRDSQLIRLKVLERHIEEDRLDVKLMWRDRGMPSPLRADATIEG